GVSGSAAERLLGALGVPGVVYAAKDRPFTAAAARRHRLVVFSPGFASGHPWLGAARGAGADCWGELDFASLFWKGSVVAVTGTNGKTTVTEFLTHALRGAGREAYAAGNIGRALSALVADRDGGLPSDLAVCEVSSFQAESLRHLRASATLWINFAEDHLERHAGLPEYFAAKAALANRSDALFAGSSVWTFAQREPSALGLLRGAGRIAWVPTEAQPADALLAGTVFAEYPQRENFLLAAAWWKAAGLAARILYDAARDFRLGAHRLARVGARGGVAYWNDSKATNFHAAEAALRRFAVPVLLIAGGKSKGGDLEGFARRIASRVRHAFLIGDAAPALASALDAAMVPHTRCVSLREAVRAASSSAHPGDQIVLSPGFSSLDQFRSYEDRGAQFEALARDRIASPAAPPLVSHRTESP
ncbi:MAG: UDP-N-acetylmuramoyl-L-alanine--D-glutamate ligase, partial [Opitutaceae bacterium]